MKTINIHEAEGRNLKITLKSGKIHSGLGEWYASELDNECAEYKPGVAHICIGDMAFYEDEIAKIELTGSSIPLAQAV